MWNASDALSLRFNYLYNENTFTEPKVVDAIFRTFGDPGIIDVIGLPEFYGTVPGLEPYNAGNNQAGFPGGRVGEWENRSNMTAANEIEQERSRSTSTGTSASRCRVQFLTGYTDQFNKLANDWDGSQYDVVYDLNQQDNELCSAKRSSSRAARGRSQLGRRRVLLEANELPSRHA